MSNNEHRLSLGFSKKSEEQMIAIAFLKKIPGRQKSAFLATLVVDFINNQEGKGNKQKFNNSNQTKYQKKSSKEKTEKINKFEDTSHKLNQELSKHIAEPAAIIENNSNELSETEKQYPLPHNKEIFEEDSEHNHLILEPPVNATPEISVNNSEPKALDENELSAEEVRDIKEALDLFLRKMS